MTKTNKTKYYCRYCGTVVDMPETEYGLGTTELKPLHCVRCLAKGKRRKMHKVLEECSK